MDSSCWLAAGAFVNQKTPQKTSAAFVAARAACRLGSLSGGRQSDRPKRVVGQCKRFCAKSPDALLFGRVLFCSPVSSGLVATMLLRPSMPPRGNLFSVSDCVTWLHLPLWLGFSRQRIRMFHGYQCCQRRISHMRHHQRWNCEGERPSHFPSMSRRLKSCFF